MRARAVALTLSAASAVLVPTSVGAQAGFTVSPSVSTTQVYDSNIWSSSTDRQTDMVTRVTPDVRSMYRAPLWSLGARYTFDVERFARHDSLNSGSARRHAAAELEYRLSPTLAVGAGGDLSTTRTPAELNAGTGLNLPRASASRVAGYLTLTRRMSPLTVATAEYRVSQDRISGGTRVGHRVATATAERHASQRDTVSAGYRLQQFGFGLSSASSHAVSVGWTRGFTERAAFSIHGGPNLTSGTATLDLALTLRDRARAGDRSVTYARGQTTVVGLAGVVTTQSLTAHLPWGSPRSLAITLVPAFFRNEHARLRADVFRLALSVIRPVTRSVAVEAALSANVQHGNLYTGLGPQRIPRHELLVRLVAQPQALPR